MNFFERFKSLPVSSRRLLGIGVILALAVALPLFIWAVVTQRFLIIKHAASGEPGICVAQNKTVIVTPESDINGTCHNIQTAVDAVTGDGYTVQIQQGSYNVSSTINVTGKSNITIRGGQSSGDVGINFNNSNGWGFYIASSSGSIEWLTASGITPNGLLSIKDSANFSVGYTSLFATSSHTLDIQNSNNISIFNTEIQSSAGALEVGGSNIVHITNNKIHNSDNAISVNNSQGVEIVGNLLYQNRETAIRIYSTQDLTAQHNSMLYDGLEGFPTLSANQNSSNIRLYQNIIAFGGGSGISFDSNTITRSIGNNDVYNNPHPNYVGIDDYAEAGVNGNISANPLVNTAPNYGYCLLPGSPAIYGSLSQPDYMGYISSCGTNPPPTPTPTPTPSADCFTCNQNNQCVFDAGCQMPGTRCGNGASCTATPTPPPTVRPFQILLKLDGVTGDAANLAKVTVRFISKVLDNTLGYTTPPIPIIYNGNGVYRLNFGIWSTFLPASTDYALVIKGEKHLGMKFCEPAGQTTHCLTSGGGYILLPANPLNLVSLDFTRIPLEPGDLPPQDGVANAQDFAKINELLSKPCSSLTDQERITADLDYNGCVNIRDAFLMRKALETRYDEN